MSSNALAVRGTGELVPVDDTRTKLVIAEQFARSGFFSDAREAAQAFVKIQYGAELGIGPGASMAGIHIVKGKPSLSASLIAARIKGSGKYDYRIKHHTDEKCVITFFEGGEVVGDADFTIEQAKKAGLVKADTPWVSYPKNMLFSRAMSNGAKLYCPDIFMGPIYTPEELGAPVDEAGQVIDVTPPAPVAEQPSAKPPALATPEQIEEIRGLLRPAGKTLDSILLAYHVADLSELSQSKASKVIRRLEELADSAPAVTPIEVPELQGHSDEADDFDQALPPEPRSEEAKAAKA